MVIMLDVYVVTKNWLEVAMAGHSSTDSRTNETSGGNLMHLY